MEDASQSKGDGQIWQLFFLTCSEKYNKINLPEKYMNIAIEQINIEEKEILKNLLEKYNYEFSQYDNRKVNKLGLYGYDYLDHYWVENNRYAYFIRADNNLAGFVMVNDYREINIKTDYTMSEFFVMYKYRRLGIGEYAVNYLLNKFRGKWQLQYHPKNIVSEQFWIKVINEYTKGKYEIIKNIPKARYEDGTIGNVMIFETYR
jgi:predicted acetyltransferase